MAEPRRRSTRRSSSSRWQQHLSNRRLNQKTNLSLTHSVLRAGKIQTKTPQAKSRPRASSNCLRITMRARPRSSSQSRRTARRTTAPSWATGRTESRETVRTKITNSSVLSMWCCKSIRSSKESTDHQLSIIKSASPRKLSHSSQSLRQCREAATQWVKSESCRLCRSATPPRRMARTVRR